MSTSRATTRNTTGEILKRALNVGVLDIRHSMIMNLVNTGDHAGTEARLREIAPIYKHEWKMAASYYRSMQPDEDVDDEDR
jgi:hypothetical protein